MTTNDGDLFLDFVTLGGLGSGADPNNWDRDWGQHVAGCSLYLQAGRTSAGDVLRVANAGKDWVYNWEYEETAEHSGWAKGVSDAQKALAYIRQLEAAGAPHYRDGASIYFSNDNGDNPTDPAILDYINGARSVVESQSPWLVDSYAGYYTVKFLYDNGAIRWPWQAKAWSGGNIHPATAVYQIQNGAGYGGAADKDVVMNGGPNSHLNVRSGDDLSAQFEADGAVFFKDVRDDLAVKQQQINALTGAVGTLVAHITANNASKPGLLGADLRNALAQHTGQLNVLSDPNGGVGVRTAQLQAALAQQSAQIVALQGALDAVAAAVQGGTAAGLTEDQVIAAAQSGAAAALAQSEFTLTAKSPGA